MRISRFNSPLRLARRGCRTFDEVGPKRVQFVLLVRGQALLKLFVYPENAGAPLHFWIAFVSRAEHCPRIDFRLLNVPRPQPLADEIMDKASERESLSIRATSVERLLRSSPIRSQPEKFFVRH